MSWGVDGWMDWMDWMGGILTCVCVQDLSCLGPAAGSPKPWSIHWRPCGPRPRRSPSPHCENPPPHGSLSPPLCAWLSCRRCFFCFCLVRPSTSRPSTTSPRGNCMRQCTPGSTSWLSGLMTPLPSGLRVTCEGHPRLHLLVFRFQPTLTPAGTSSWESPTRFAITLPGSSQAGRRVSPFSERNIGLSANQEIIFFIVDSKLYGYILGMYAFGLEESNFYRQAEDAALKGILPLLPKKILYFRSFI